MLGGDAVPAEVAMRPFTLLTVVFLALAAAAHLLRAMLGLPVQVGALALPVWTSVAAFLFCAALAGLLTWEQRRR